jgi:hypothetical protein
VHCTFTGVGPKRFVGSKVMLAGKLLPLRLEVARNIADCVSQKHTREDVSAGARELRRCREQRDGERRSEVGSHVREQDAALRSRLFTVAHRKKRDAKTAEKKPDQARQGLVQTILRGVRSDKRKKQRRFQKIKRLMSSPSVPWSVTVLLKFMDSRVYACACSPQDLVSTMHYRTSNPATSRGAGLHRGLR